MSLLRNLSSMENPVELVDTALVYLQMEAPDANWYLPLLPQLCIVLCYLPLLSQMLMGSIFF